MTADFNNTNLSGIALRRKWHLLVLVVLAGASSFFFSGGQFIHPKYESVAVVYPVNIIPYSMESPTEQLLQLFNSADVRGMMIDRFHLDQHYRIDTKIRGGQTKLFNAYDENVSVRETEFESVRITITDENPDTACAMVNALVQFVNDKARNLQRGKTHELVVIYRDQLAFKQQQIDSLETIMNQLRVRYGLLDYAAQSKEVTRGYLKMLDDGAPPARIRPVDSLMRNLEEKGSDFMSVSDQLTSLRSAYDAIKTDYDKSLSDYSKQLTYSNLVTKPFPADSKCYPVRWLIMAVSVVSTFILALLFFAFIDRKRNDLQKHSEPADR